MRTLRLIDPQPMETLPEEETVFIQITMKPKPSFSYIEPDLLVRPAGKHERTQLERSGYILKAWSYIAKFVEEGDTV